MKKAIWFLSILVITSLACNFGVTVGTPTSPAPLPAETIIPTNPVPNATATAPQPSFEGVAVMFDKVSLVLPPGLASGAGGTQLPRTEGDDVAPWELTPGHVLLDLEGYILQDKFHKPRIYVYPAQGYAEVLPSAFDDIQRLTSILNAPGAPIASDQLPHIPFFNAGQLFASNIEVISFQNGKGVRFVTEYAQYYAPPNNHDLFYHFQGLTNDGAYYIIAILPISAPALAENSELGATVPVGGVPYPDMADPNANWEGYYTAVTNFLDATAPEAFSPTIAQLDLLIQSVKIAQ
jgi:hypothetical protein